MSNISNLDNQQKKEICLYLFVGLLFVYPIIHANVYYHDDTSRLINGNYGWSISSRILGEFFTHIFSLSPLSFNCLKLCRGVIDVAPLSQIVAVLFLASGAFVFNQYMKRMYGHSFIFIAILIIVNPFFLQNLSYKFDSWQMAFGIFLSVLSFSRDPQKKDYFISIGLLFLSLSVYQPCANLFLGLVGLELLTCNIKDFKFSIGTFVKKSSIFVSAHLIYAVTVVKIFEGTRNAYAIQHSQVVNIDSDGLRTVLENIELFIKKSLSMFFSEQILFYTSVILLICIYSIIVTIIRSNQKSGFLSCLILSLSCFILSLGGSLVFLKSPVIMLRVFCSFSVSFMILSFLISINHKKVACFASAFFVFMSIVISFQYGSALHNQNAFEKRILALIHQDVLKISNKNTKIHLILLSFQNSR